MEYAIINSEIEATWESAKLSQYLGFAFSDRPWIKGDAVGNSYTPAECLEDTSEDVEHKGTCAWALSECDSEGSFSVEKIIRIASCYGIGPAFGQNNLALLIGDGQNDGGEVGLAEGEAVCIENAVVSAAWVL